MVSIVMAILLGLAERLGPRLKQLTQVEGRDGFVVGLAQLLALILAFRALEARLRHLCLMDGNGRMRRASPFC